MKAYIFELLFIIVFLNHSILFVRGNVLTKSEVEGRASFLSQGPQEGIDGKLVSGQSEAPSILSLLLEIKQSVEQYKKPPDEIWKEEFKEFKQEIQSAVDRIQKQVDDLSKSSNQKVDIMLQAFSGLGVLVTSDTKKIDDSLSRLRQVERKIFELENTLKNQKTPDLPLDALASVTSNVVDLPLNSHLTVDTLTASLQEPNENLLRSGDTEEDDNVHNKKRTSSPNQLLERLTNNKLAVTAPLPLPKDESRVPNKENSSPLCSCNTTKIETSLISLQEQMEPVRDDYQLLLSIVNKSLEEVKLNFTVVESVKENQRRKIQGIESSLLNLKIWNANFSKMKSEISDLKQNVEEVKSSLEPIKHLNISTPQPYSHPIEKRLCVWPYVRKAGSCFFVSNTKMLSWQKAREHCKEKQGDLASPKHLQEFKNFLSSEKLSRSYSYWIGGTDIERDGEWKWIDNTPVPMVTDLWASGQPNEGKSSNCLSLKLHSRNISGSDDDCSKSYFFVCEQER